MPVTKRVVAVTGFEELGTEVWEIQPIAVDPQLHILIIPGNPGSAGYYSQFMRNLHQAFDGKATVTSLSSLGFHTLESPLHKQHRTYNLQEQCAHKAAYLQQHIFPKHSIPVVLVGHSIGLYIAMQAIHMCEGTTDSYSRQQRTDVSPSRAAASDRSGFDKNGNPRVIQIIGMMPFIQTTRSNGVQRRLRAMSHRAHLLGLVGALLGILPLQLRLLIVQLADGDLDKECTETTAALMRSDAVRVAFTMAYFEFTDLDSDEGWRDVEHFAHRLAVLAGPNDAWWPQTQHRRAQKILDDIDIELQPEQKHAFCTSPHCSSLATQASEGWIKRALDKHAATCAAAAARPAGVTTREMSTGSRAGRGGTPTG